MNNELNKYEASRGPLIFTMPASRFLVALNVDWLEETDWEKNRGRGVERSQGAPRSYQRGRRNPRPPDTLAFWRRYSA
jgi:hypothetical protein